MALPKTGPISLSMVNVELGRPANAAISLNDPAVRRLAGRPSGSISFADLRGKANELVHIISSNKANYNLWIALGSKLPAAKVIRVNINPGVVVYATSTGTPAFNVGNAFKGKTIILVNNGTIRGKDGAGGGGGNNAGGNGGNGGAGGTALYTRIFGGSSFQLYNRGVIEGGGGGGGGGGGARAKFTERWSKPIGHGDTDFVNEYYDLRSAGGRGGNAPSGGGAGGAAQQGVSYPYYPPTTYAQGGRGGNGGGRGARGANGANAAAVVPSANISRLSDSSLLTLNIKLAGRGGAGGRGGYAVDGHSKLSWKSTGTLRGSRVH